MTKGISILGSTGSIGIQTLDVARNLGIKVAGLAANSNIDLLEKQAWEFKPGIVAVNDEKLWKELASRLKGTGIEVVSGVEGVKEAAACDGADTVVSAIVGIAGLIPTMHAIKSGRNIALANKETLVTAGHIIMQECKHRNIELLPVDSEHSAIFQSLMGNRKEDVFRILLTASGGPFRGKTREELQHVTLQEALKHPNWSMGRKITIDSATLMNKGLEVIEARWLFDMGQENIKVLIHPQSVVHSAVEYVDGSVIAQMGSADMRLPIQFALTYPRRNENNFKRLNLTEIGKLTFEEPDERSFPCLSLAYEALKAGGTMPVVLNAANEAAVGMFLKERVRFVDIPEIIGRIMAIHTVNTNPSLDDIIEIDAWAREQISKIYNR